MKKMQILMMALLFFLNLETSALANGLDELDDEEWDLWDENADEEFEPEDHQGSEEDNREPENRDEDGKIFMKLELMDDDILKLSVMAENVQIPVIGLAFHLKYEKEKLYFLKYEPGEFLEDGGDPFYMVQNDTNKAKIIFGETLRRDDRFPVGGKEIVNFYFQTSGENLWRNEVIKFEFERPVISSIDTVRQDISGVKWENLYADKNGINHWLQDNSLNSDFGAVKAGSKFENNKVWFLLAGIIGIFFFIKKFLVEKWLKNKDRKRHISYVNFK